MSTFKPKQTMFETVAKTTRGMGTHDYNALKAAYGSSPIHNDLDDQKQDIVFILWPNQPLDQIPKPDCYNANDIKRSMSNKDTRMVEWVHNGISDLDNLSQADKDVGMGYAPKQGAPVYIKLWPQDEYVSIDSVNKMLKSKKRHFDAVIISKNVRIGNTRGWRGNSF